MNPTLVSDVEDLKSLIKAQLSGDVLDRFDVGYVQSNKVVSLRSKEDVRDLMGSVQNGDSILWCDGLQKETRKEKNSRKRKNKSTIDSSDSDNENLPSKRSKREDREDKVQRCVEELKEKHGQSYTSMQYRIWAELLSGGVYNSTFEAPTHSTMFVKAGGGQKRKSTVGNGAHATLTSSLGTSPAKVIDNRSKCYKQLTDLGNLKESGVLSEAEYASEREAIMSVLKTLSK